MISCSLIKYHLEEEEDDDVRSTKIDSQIGRLNTDLKNSDLASEVTASNPSHVPLSSVGLALDEL